MTKFKAKNRTKIEVGDRVMIECDSGLGSGGPSIVTKITNEKIATKKDGSIIKNMETTKVIWCGNHAFSVKNGRALNVPWAYHI